MDIGQFNGLDRDGFVRALGWTVDDSPWVAERAWDQRPFESLEALHEAMAEVVRHASREEQLALLRAHPDLGSRARMSSASEGEQSGAGLDCMPTDAFARLQERNAAYRAKFGFPFLYAVKGSSWPQILEALDARLGNSPEEEFAAALEQVCRIAWFRLSA
jgi:2-oxo-4-hydroxy-4-carboxy-5-ureidoimidazoline decarboxylase